MHFLLTIAIEKNLRDMRQSKYNNDYDINCAIDALDVLITMGNVTRVSQIFDQIPKTEFSSHTGIAYTRLKYIARRPASINSKELDTLSALFPGAGKNRVRALFDGY